MVTNRGARAQRLSRSRSLVVTTALGALLLAACSSTATGATSQDPSSGGQSASAGPSSPAGDSTSGSTGADPSASQDVISFDLPFGSGVSTPGHLPVYVALQLGLFQKHGLNPKVISTEGGGNSVNAFLADKNAPIAITSTPSTITSIQGGAPIKFVGRVLDATTVNWVYRSDLGNLGLNSGLKGKKFAITAPGSATDLQLSTIASKSGLTRKDIVTINAGTAAAEAQLLDAGKTDVAALNDYLALPRIEAGTAKLLVQGVDIAPDIFSIAVTAKDTTIKENPDLIRRFFAALNDAKAEMVNNPDDPRWVQYAMDLVKAPPGQEDAFKQLIKGYLSKVNSFWDFTVSADDFPPIMKQMLEQGQIEQPLPDPASLVDMSWKS
jgi:ABC-type nitrate/sulfonate/bicarbonate transport system substrate-binding protein/predicted small secreted protein